MAFVPGFVVAFVIVAGWAIVRWRLHGRDPAYLDDDSILLGDPPEGMTAAVATIIAGGPATTAFMAALLDLASRDEIAFRDETPAARGPHAVGIEIRGGPSDDPRVALNRRRPIGEGEAWLRGALRAFAAGGGPGVEPEERGLLAMETLSSVLGMAMGGAPGATDGTTDPLAGLEAALLRVTATRGGPPAQALVREAVEHPDTVLADPAGWADRIGDLTGTRPSPDEVARLARWVQVRRAAAQHQAWQQEFGTGSDVEHDYISADRALTFQAPIGFGTLLENYARRQGWIAGLPVATRWRWRALAVAEAILGLTIIVLAAPSADVLTIAATPSMALPVGVGAGVLLGGLATWRVAPHMPSRTHAGAVMRAQVAAYGRTLKATFASSATLDDAVASSRLAWLETPDQALVWGVALGLREEIEALLARTRRGIEAGTVDRGAFLPRWVDRVTDAARDGMAAAIAAATGTSAARGAVPGAAAQPDGPEDYALMFAGIERIGSRTAPDGPALALPV